MPALTRDAAAERSVTKIVVFIVQCSGVIVKMKICGDCREGKDA
jgi:hypothetical protein